MLAKSSPKSDNDSNKRTYESNDVASRYSHFYLQEPEKTVLNTLRSELAELKMLDVGVGAGRTSFFFAGLAKEYFGIDYSEKMIEACRLRFRDSPFKVTFKVCDVRSLTCFKDNYFDFVLFSYNGIDYVGHQDRIRALREIRRVTTRNGYFFFSAHNLNFARQLLKFRPAKNPVAIMAELRRLVMLRYINRVALRDLSRKYAILNDGTLNFRLKTYYVKPQEQIKQLADLGFINIRLYGLSDGKEIKPPFMFDRMNDPWLYYLCNVGPK